MVTLDFLNVESGVALPINCINRTSTSSNVLWYNILESVTGLGVTMADTLPASARGQITLYNEADSWNSEMRISDLLAKHTLIGREITVYVGNTELEDEPSLLGDLVEVWKARCTSVQFDKTAMRVAFQKTYLEARSMNFVVNNAAFALAPNQSLGKQLPLIIGDWTQVEATQVTTQYLDGSEELLTYAYATTLGNQFTPAGSSTDDPRFLYENPITKKHQQVKFVGTDPFTPVYEQDIVPVGGSHIGSVLNLWEQLQSVAYKLQPGQNVTGGEIITGVNWYLACNDHAGFTGTEEGNYTLTIFRDANGMPGSEIGRATVQFDDPALQYLGVVNTYNVYNFRFYLPNPVMIPEDEPIYIGLTRSDKDEWFAPIQDDGPLGAGRATSFEKYVILIPQDFTDPDAPKDLAASKEYVRETTNLGLDHFEVFGLALTHDNSGGPSGTWQNGLGFATATIKQRNVGFIPDLTRLRFVIEAKGIRDDGSGSITGGANARLEYPKDVVNCLLREWNGTTWATGRFDSTTFNTTHAAVNSATGRWPIKLKGATNGRNTLESLLNQLLGQSYGRLIPQANGQLALWHWGTELAVSGAIEDELLQFDGAEIGGVETIINRVQGVYGQRIINNSVEALMSDGSLSKYSAAFDSFADTSDIDYPLTVLSQSFYGIRELGNIENQWIGDAASMASFAALTLRLFPLPKMTALVTLLDRDASELQVGEVVSFRSVSMPAQYGTTHNARQALAGTEEEATTLIGGHYWKRQQKYRCLIEGSSLELSKTTAPERRLNLRVLPRSIQT